MSSMWLVGAALSLVGSIASNLGVNVQKYSFMKNEQMPVDQRLDYHQQGLWRFGLVLVVLGSLGDFAALGLAAQSIVAPMGAVTLVANVIFAHFWLGEVLSKTDLLGTGFIVLGSTVAVTFGDHSNKSYTIDDLLGYYSGRLFVTYCIVCVASITVMYLLLKKIEPIKEKLGQILDDTFSQTSEEFRDADQLEHMLRQEYKKWEKIHPFLYCALSGIFGGQSILFGKMVAVLLGQTFAGENQFTHPLTYVFLACMFGAIFTQLHFLALALRQFDALYCVPVFQCFFITVSTVGGAAYFLEFDEFTTKQWLFFPMGLAMTLWGVYLLSSHEMSTANNENSSDKPPPIAPTHKYSRSMSTPADVLFSADPDRAKGFTRSSTHVPKFELSLDECQTDEFDMTLTENMLDDFDAGIMDLENGRPYSKSVDKLL